MDSKWVSDIILKPLSSLEYWLCEIVNFWAIYPCEYPLIILAILIFSKPSFSIPLLINITIQHKFYAAFFSLSGSEFGWLQFDKKKNAKQIFS